MIIDLAHCNFVNSFEVLFHFLDSVRKSKPNFAHLTDLGQLPAAISLHCLTSFLANLSPELRCKPASPLRRPWQFVLIDLNAEGLSHVIISSRPATGHRRLLVLRV